MRLTTFFAMVFLGLFFTDASINHMRLARDIYRIMHHQGQVANDVATDAMGFLDTR